MWFWSYHQFQSLCGTDTDTDMQGENCFSFQVKHIICSGSIRTWMVAVLFLKLFTYTHKHVDSQFWQAQRPTGPTDLSSFSSSRLRLFCKFLCKLTWKGVRLPRPINIKAKADWGILNRIKSIYVYFLFIAVLLTSRRRSKAFWVALPISG